MSEDGSELRVAVIGEMSARLVHFHPADVRRVNGLIPATEQFLLDELFEQRANGRSLGHPQTEALAHVVGDCEQPELFAEDAVIAALGFLDLHQVSGQIFFLKEGRPIQSLKLAIGGVSLPVRAGDGDQLERLDAAGVRNMWPAAEVDEFPLPIKAHGWMFSQPRVDVLDLQPLMQTQAEFAGFFTIEDEPLERFGLLDDLPHLLLDPREIFLADLLGRVEIVIVAVGESGPEREVNVREQSHHGPGHHMGTRVSQHGECLGVAVGEQPQIDRFFDVGHFRQRACRIHNRTIGSGCQNGLCEPRADAFSDIERRTVGRKLLDGAVGQTDGNHVRADASGSGPPGPPSRMAGASGSAESLLVYSPAAGAASRTATAQPSIPTRHNGDVVARSHFACKNCVETPDI